MSGQASAQKRKKSGAASVAPTTSRGSAAASEVDVETANTPSAKIATSDGDTKAETAVDAGVPTPVAVLSEDHTRNAWMIGISLGVAGTIGAALLFGPSLAVLVLAGCAAASVIALFWQSLRTLIGEAPLTSADTLAAYSVGAEEEQKRAVLRAMKDLEFERNVGKISEEDYTRLLLRYRSQAKSLLKQIDEKGAAERRKAEKLVADRFQRQGLGPARATVAPVPTPPVDVAVGTAPDVAAEQSSVASGSEAGAIVESDATAEAGAAATTAREAADAARPEADEAVRPEADEAGAPTSEKKS